jgi:putative transposase
LFNWIIVCIFVIINQSIIKKMQKYPTGLTDSQWAKIEKLFDSRKRKYSLREILNALLYITKSGIQWRMLPKEYPKWQLVYYYFRKWTGEGLIEEMHDILRAMCRKQSGREESPSLGLIDSQTVKTSSMTKEKGYDGGKKIQGRKRHMVTDTMGFIMAVVVHGADIQDREGAKTVLQALRFKFPRLRKIPADGGYTGELALWVLQLAGWTLEIVAKVAGVGFNVIPKRWIVERTFGWFNFNRRLARDYELNIDCSTAFIHLTMCRIMLNRIRK